MLRRAEDEGGGYDLVHTHYWLSGWVGRSAREIWGVPLVASFHTLGKVKNYSLSRGSPARGRSSARWRGAGDRRRRPSRRRDARRGAQLVGLYRADPGRIRVVPPGVNHELFFPRQPDAAKARLHLTDVQMLLFVGRLQAHKGPTSPSAPSRRPWRGNRRERATSSSRSSAARAARTTAPRWRG